MSSNHSDRKLDELLDQHIAALRDEPIDPATPSDTTIASTLERLREAEAKPSRRPFIERLAIMSFTQRIAAVVMLTLGAMTIYVMFALFNTLGPSVAFADVAQKLKAARTLQYTNTVSLAGSPTRSFKTLMAEPDRMRIEMPDGIVSLKEGGVTLILDNNRKTAMRVELTGVPQNQNPDATVVNALRKLGEAKGEPIGEKEIKGVACAGFKTINSTLKMSVWANKKTADPVRVEIAMPIGPGEASIVMEDFVLDAPLDDALFSMQVPAGYELKEQKFEMPQLGALEDEVAKLLKWYTEGSGGEFPPSLVDWAAFAKIKHSGKPDPQAVARLGGIFAKLFALGDNYGYLGKGAKVGDKEKIIFWCKVEGSDKYRAVFGDLHTGDVTKDQLPATQPAVK